MKSTHTRIDSDDLLLLDYLCGETGDKRRYTLKRIIRFAIKEKQRYMQAKKYLEVVSLFGEPALKVVTK